MIMAVRPNSIDSLAVIAFEKCYIQRKTKILGRVTRPAREGWIDYEIDPLADRFCCIRMGASR